MSYFVEVPFQSLEPWIWYPSFARVFWLQENMIRAMVARDASGDEQEYLDSEYVRKNYKGDIKTHLGKIQSGYDTWISINNEGFNPHRSVFRMNVLSGGHLQVIDGFHRLNILHYTQYAGNIRIEIVEEWPEWIEFKKAVISLNPYAPVGHPLLADLGCYRTDSRERLEIIRSEIPGIVENIVDLGTCEGYFALGLVDKANNMVIGVESMPERAAVARYIRNLRNYDDDLVFWTGDIVEFISGADSIEPEHFDVGIFLSTFHHLVIHMGEHSAWNGLKNLSDKIDVLFFSVAVKGDRVWENHPSIVIEEEDIPLLVEKFWGYNKYKELMVEANNGRMMYKFWRE